MSKRVRTKKAERYTLTTAILVVRQVESQATRTAVFAEIKEKNKLVRLVDKVYTLAGLLLLQPILLFLFMAKCVAAVGPAIDPRSTALSISNFNNESHSVDRVLDLVPSTRVSSLKLSNKHLFASGQLRQYLRLLLALPRCWKFLNRLARSHGFMPACRIASVLGYYIRFDHMLKSNENLSSTLIASNYSPECVGLAAAAHKNGCKVIYTNHAPVPSNSPYVPPVLADCSVFYGDIIRKTYEKRSRCNSDVVLIGQPGTASQMRWNNKVSSVGIFLTALTQLKPLETLVEKIKNDNPDAHILIRHHPVSLLQTDVSSLQERFSHIETTLGTPLDEDIAKCDMVFCGNSGVSLNVLRGGKPVAYLAELDSLPHDYLGFVSDGLVMEVGRWQAGLYDELRKFYDQPTWEQILSDYDASFGTSETELLETARAQLEGWFAPGDRSQSPTRLLHTLQTSPGKA